MSIFENPDFRIKLAEEEKHFVNIYMEKAKQMIEKNEILLAIDDLEQALEHAKIAKNHLSKANVKQNSKELEENKQLEKMELV